MSYALDILVILAYFAVILSIGLSQRSKSDSVEGFTLGDRQIAWWAVLASILAAEISAATFLGAPESGYTRRNWAYAQFAIGTVMARVIVSLIFIPVFYRHQVISLYEYLGTRFGHITRLYASATFLLTRVLAMGTRLYAAAIVLVIGYAVTTGQALDTGEKYWVFAAAVVIITLFTTIYTAVGGIRAVIWTDFIQVGVLVAALAFTIPYLLGKIPGGWDSVTEVIKQPYFFDLAESPEGGGFWVWLKHILTSDYTLWAALIGSTFVTMATHGIDQDTVQRMLTAKDRKQSALATILSGIVDLPLVSSFILIGIMLAAFYKAYPNPALPKDGSEVFPFFIMSEMPMGLRGLVVAAVISTAMGSLSTALNALGTSFAQDFIFPRRPHLEERDKVKVLRFSTALFAFFIVIIGVVTAYYKTHNPSLEILPLVLGILGFTFGSLLGVFLLAIFTKTRGSDVGNVIGMSCGILVVLYLSNVLKVQDSLGWHEVWEIKFPWRVTIGTLVTVAVAVCFKTPERRR